MSALSISVRPRVDQLPRGADAYVSVAVPHGSEPPSGLRRLVRRLGSAIGRALPEALHPLVQGARLLVTVPGAARLPDAACAAPRLTVLGYLTAPTGLGEGARLCASTFAELGFSVGMLDATALHRVPGGVPLPSGGIELAAGDIGGALICHLNPPDFEMTLRLLGLSGTRRKLIGYWAWELPVVPPSWRRAYRLVHEVWVPSQFVAEALRRSGCRRPIRVVAHPFRAPSRFTAVPAAQAPGVMTVLTVFAYESGFNRKNPLAAIDAFRLAFGDRSDVRLVIKVRGASVSGEPERRLSDRIAGAANVELWDQVLTHEEMVALIAGADVLLSLHRAEGFGIPLAEAMLMGKPVVATSWSGNLEFMDERSACLVPTTPIAAHDENSPYDGLQATWADPSVPAAAEWLRRLEDPALRRDVGARARAHASERLGAAAYAASVAPAFSGDAQTVCVKAAGLTNVGASARLMPDRD